MWRREKRKRGINREKAIGSIYVSLGKSAYQRCLMRCNISYINTLNCNDLRIRRNRSDGIGTSCLCIIELEGG